MPDALGVGEAPASAELDAAERMSVGELSAPGRGPGAGDLAAAMWLVVSLTCGCTTARSA